MTRPKARYEPVMSTWRTVLWDIWWCAYCGRESTYTSLDPDGAIWHLDHVRPVAEGGTDDPDNVVKSCARCNMAKGTADWWWHEFMVTARDAIVNRWYSELISDGDQRARPVLEELEEFYAEAARQAHRTRTLNPQYIKRDWFLFASRKVYA